ncbi:hypothetical protein Pmar_PMAR017177 [Perkinsus marinus ATCC 50983]|uniref:Uncharacterized protein n=1 Tax=Perkinsus marinus (strain ATCC 50983 / TXsc) TaxID=423536 RepID=C5LSS7_PERM5|nr:hypothetical protein Pmar_PMAR017177 [Perkinsus marinus ATCC 50983]EER00318.1 hypothetical protein Pmar_PMAR017177 [Perkinsus marinus ATCC 50983]|eukprot:XP_002767600.1 hypothetical protein Pmar_PMAR017177 [Perkinsus marinus ATCC 50983]
MPFYEQSAGYKLPEGMWEKEEAAFGRAGSTPRMGFAKRERYKRWAKWFAGGCVLGGLGTALVQSIRYRTLRGQGANIVQGSLMVGALTMFEFMVGLGSQ